MIPSVFPFLNKKGELMAKATNPIKHTFLREGELSIDKF